MYLLRQKTTQKKSIIIHIYICLHMIHDDQIWGLWGLTSKIFATSTPSDRQMLGKMPIGAHSRRLLVVSAKRNFGVCKLTIQIHLLHHLTSSYLWPLLKSHSQLVNLVSSLGRHRPVPWIWQLRLILDEHLPVPAPELVQPHHLGAVAA